MLSGLQEFLGSISEVRDVKVTPGTPLSIGDVTSWERIHHCALPEDLKSFYLSNNGLLVEWSYQYNESVLKLGRISISALSQMKPLHLEKKRNRADISLLNLDVIGNSTWKPSFGGSCKIFSLDHCPTCGDICLVYDTEKEVDEECSVWLLDLSLNWHYLCRSFSDLLRLAVIHLGLYQWPYALIPHGLSPQYERWFHMFIPKRLELDMENVSQSLSGRTPFPRDPTNAGGDSPVKTSQSHSLNHLDISKVLYSKSLRDRKSKVDPSLVPRKSQSTSK